MRDAWWDLRDGLHPSGFYLLGYPTNSTIAYDASPGPEWTSLLTLNSDDELGWSWLDGDWLATFIRSDAMRAGDFAEIRAETG